VGTAVFALSLLLVFVVLVAAPPVNGAHRWLPLGSFGLQPSEFLKPGFVVVAAWMLAEGTKNRQFPGALIAMALYLVSAAMLILQPDYGQALLLTSVWAAMFFIAGWSIYWLIGLGFIGGATIAAGYFYSPHLAKRIDGFINPEAGDNYQVDKSVEALANGGIAGRAPDAANVKLSLPDAHTDFIFAVAGEERGFLFCLFIMALFLAFVIRTFLKAMNLKSVFAQTAVCGLGAMIGLQAFINMGVAMRALPAKGMTLPFISNGGSSLIAMGLAVGLILALTRVQGTARSRRELMP
jgi:cell division protein FtsW